MRNARPIGAGIFNKFYNFGRTFNINTMELKDVKTKEDLEKLDPKQKKTFKMVGIIIAVLSIFLLAKLCMPSEEVIEEGWQDTYIVGLDPENTWLNVKQWGFEVKMNFDADWGNSWTCTRQDYGIKQTVVIFSPKAETKASSVTFTVQVDPGTDINEGRQFAEKVATIIYDSADPLKAQQFVSDNYNTDNASIVIGDAQFTMRTPSVYVRVLEIQKYNE